MPNDKTPSQPSNTPMIVMVAGALVVVGLVGWALTRSVQPAPVASTEPPLATSAPSTTAAPSTGTSAPAPNAFSIPAGGPQEADKAAVARIAVEDLRAKYDRGEVTVIDVRATSAYEDGHIAGALGIPMASIEGQADSLPKGKPIVTYCT